MSVKLTTDQQNASDKFIDFLVDDNEKYMVIQGGAGSGKSFLIKHLLETFQAKYKTYNILLQKNPEHEFQTYLTATTNKAVTVVKDFVGSNMDVKTIHSLLGLKVVNDLKSGKTKLIKTKEHGVLVNALIIIDEASFISDELFDIIDGTTKACKVLLVGDQYQLAPVGQQESVMETLDCAKATMNKIMRNSGTILETSAQFRNTVETGTFKAIQFTDNKLIHVDGPTFSTLLKDAFTSPDYHPTSAKFLAWENQRVQDCNNLIRSMKGLPEDFLLGETVVTNNPIISKNGHISTDSQVVITNHKGTNTIEGIKGRIVQINNFHEAFLPNSYLEVKALLKQLAKKKDWKAFYTIKDTWLDLRSVYASSVHKSQGSSYEKVFIDLTNIGKNWIASDVARLMYVAISRSSEQVICYGKLPTKYGG